MPLGASHRRRQQVVSYYSFPTCDLAANPIGKFAIREARSALSKHSSVEDCTLKLQAAPLVCRRTIWLVKEGEKVSERERSGFRLPAPN